MDFSNVKAVTIPEGDVKQIDIDGVTVWISAPSGITVTLNNSGHSEYCYVEYNGIKYYTSDDTFTVESGEVMTCFIYAGIGTCYVTINGNTVAYANQTLSYEWEIPSNINSISITLKRALGQSGVIVMTS